MALPLANNAEGGSNTTTVTTGNSGGGSGNAWDVVNITNGAATFSSTVAAHGSLAYAFSTTASSGVANVGWTSSVGVVTTFYGRAYVYLTGSPTSPDANVQIRGTGSSTGGNIQISTARQIVAQTPSFANAFTFTTVLALSTWYRIEWQMVTGSAGSANFTINLYVGDSGTVTETHTDSTFAWGGTGGVAEVEFGWTNTHPSQPTLYMDDIQVNSTGFPGPAIQPSPLTQPADVAAAVEKLSVAATLPAADVAAAVEKLSVSAAQPAADVAAAVESISIVPITATGPSTFIGALPGDFVPAKLGMSVPVLAPGYAGGPSGGSATLSPAVGNGWEVYVRSGANYTTLLAIVPQTMLLNLQFVRQLDDIGSGTIALSMDDPWWNLVTLPGGLPTHALLDQECLWQVYQDGVCRFEFFGETVTEQLVDPSEQRVATITGPGTIAALKWAMVAPNGFPNIVLKLDGIQDSFDEVNGAGQGVLDTNIWSTATPATHVQITPIAVLYNYPGGAGYNLSSLYPSGSLTLVASPGTTFLGASPYDATDTLISAQVTPLGVSANASDSLTPAKYGTGLNGSELTQFYIESNLNLNYYAMFGLSASAFYCQFRGPSGTYTKILPAYNSSTHAYWMITEQGGTGGGPGTFYFWTSPDGQAWTMQWTIVHNWDARNVSFYYTAAYSTDDKVTAQLANLNSNVTTPSYQGSIYLGVPMMNVWLDQFQAAQARGTDQFVTSDITRAADSYGRAWTDLQNVQASNGTDMYTLLQSACSVVNADYVMDPGFRLRVGQPAAGQVSLGVDRSQYLIMRDGLDCAARQRVRARNQITTLIGGQNTDGHEISASAPAFITQWGQREAWYQTAVQVDPLSMAYATAAALAQNETEVLSWTLTITPNITGKTVFKNFDVGDWIGLERPDFSAIDDVRVMAIAIQVDQNGAETHELTLISYIQWLQEQLTYISNRMGGTFVNVIGTTPVAPSKYGTGQVPTYYTPAATLAGLADVATGSGGSTKSAAPLVYNAATGQYQQAGTVDPVSGVNLPMTVGGPGQATVTTTQTGTVVIDASGAVRNVTGLQPDGTVTSQDSNGAAPGVPDTPAVTGTVQGVTIAWDGLLGGVAPKLDFQYVQVYLGTSAVFTPGPGTLMGTLLTGGAMSVWNLTAGVTYWAKLVAVNTSNIPSAASGSAPGTATGVPGGVITGQIPASVLGNSAGSWALNPNPFFNGGSLFAWTALSATLTATASGPAGAPGSPAYVAQLVSTGAGGSMSGSGAPFPVTAGNPYAMTAWVYNPAGGSVSVAIGFSWAGGTQAFTVPPGVWTPLTFVSNAPGGTTSGYQVISLPSSGVTVYVSGAVAAGQVNGQLITAQTVTANQIAAGIILAGVVNGTLVEGAQVVAYGVNGEVLIYSDTPAVGNLIGSWSAIAGNDAAIAGGAGNNYPAGMMVGVPGSSQAQLLPNAGQAFNLTSVVAGVLTAAAQFTSGDAAEVFPGLLGALNLSAGTTAKQSLVATSPIASTVGAAMVLESENDGGTDTAVVTFGTVSSPDGSTIVFTPLMALTPYAMVLYSGTSTVVIVTKTTGSGTIPIPAGVTVGKGETWGASGGSGSSTGAVSVGGTGAGGGEYACEPALALTAGGTAAYAVGAAGTASAGSGTNGGNTTLTGSAVTVTAHGGNGGQSNSASSASPPGGTGSANTIHFNGGGGGWAPALYGGGGGGGGSAGPSGGGRGGSNSVASAGAAGALAVAGGGQGGSGGAGRGTGVGGTGFAGVAPGGGPGGAGGSNTTVNGHVGVAGQARLTYITGTPAVGLSVNYGASFTDQYGNTIPAGMSLGFTGTSAATKSATGVAGTLPSVQTSTASHTNANATVQLLSATWTIPANDAQVGTLYEIWVPFSFTSATTTLETLGFKPYLNAAQVTTSNGDVIGATAQVANTVYSGKVRCTLQLLTTGTSGTANVFIEGGYAQAGNLQASGSSNFLSSQATGITFNTTVSNTLAIVSVYTTASTGQTITGTGSKFTREGP
jgi:hypothetical protein